MSVSAMFQSLCYLMFSIVAAMSLTGCVCPGGPTVVAGHKYSRAEMSFLRLPGTWREEAIATLGPPVWESRQSRILLYVWTTSMHWVVALPSGGTEFQADEKSRALLNSCVAWTSPGTQACSHDFSLNSRLYRPFSAPFLARKGCEINPGWRERTVCLSSLQSLRTPPCQRFNLARRLLG
jgi:hypothetical protein